VLERSKRLRVRFFDGTIKTGRGGAKWWIWNEYELEEETKFEGTRCEGIVIVGWARGKKNTGWVQPTHREVHNSVKARQSRADGHT